MSWIVPLPYIKSFAGSQSFTGVGKTLAGDTSSHTLCRFAPFPLHGVISMESFRICCFLRGGSRFSTLSSRLLLLSQIQLKYDLFCDSQDFLSLVSVTSSGIIYVTYSICPGNYKIFKGRDSAFLTCISPVSSSLTLDT